MHGRFGSIVHWTRCPPAVAAADTANVLMDKQKIGLHAYQWVYITLNTIWKEYLFIDEVKFVKMLLNCV